MLRVSASFLAAIAFGVFIGEDANAETSLYECKGLETRKTLPVLEGHDGAFFRVLIDLRTSHHFPDAAVDLLAEFASVLRRNGTELIYVPMPTKSLTMPAFLPERAETYGFDPELAATIFDDVIDRLSNSGVETVNLREVLLHQGDAPVPFFGADFHWTSDGARAAAKAIAAHIDEVTDFTADDLDRYETIIGERTQLASTLRPIIQGHCLETVPHVADTPSNTTKVSGGDVLDLFGKDTSRVVLAGTSFSAFSSANLDGWLSQYSGLDVANVAVDGGNSYGAILPYILSDEFRDTPPNVLVWENPIYNNLLDRGDRQLRELIFAAAAQCEPMGDGADLQFEKAAFDPSAALEILTQETSREVTVSFEMADGSTFRESIRRSRQSGLTDRFYVPLSSLPEAPSRVQVAVDGEDLTDTQVALCLIDLSDQS